MNMYHIGRNPSTSQSNTKSVVYERKSWPRWLNPLTTKCTVVRSSNLLDLTTENLYTLATALSICANLVDMSCEGGAKEGEDQRLCLPLGTGFIHESVKATLIFCFFRRSTTGLKEYSSSLSTMLDSERQTEFLRDRRSSDG